MNWSKNLDYFAPVALSIGISLGFSQIYLSSTGFSTYVNLSRFGLPYQLMLTAFSVALGLVGVSVFYYLLTRRKDFETRVVAALVFAPTTAVIVILVSQAVLLSVAKEAYSYLVAFIIIVSIFIAVFSTVFILADIFSRRSRNVLYIIYGSILGGFLGLIFPSMMLTVILWSLALFDAFMMRTALKRIAVDLQQDRGPISKFSYTGEYFQLGLGEFLFYSTLPAHVNAYFDGVTLVLTVMMIFVGLLLNLRMLKGREYIAGIPLPVLLGTMPMIIKALVIGFL